MIVMQIGLNESMGTRDPKNYILLNKPDRQN